MEVKEGVVMLWNAVMELNNFFVNRFNTRTLFMLYYGRNIEIIFYIGKQVASVMTKNF